MDCKTALGKAMEARSVTRQAWNDSSEAARDAAAKVVASNWAVSDWNSANGNEALNQSVFDVAILLGRMRKRSFMEETT